MKFKGVVFDMDGVLRIGEHPVNYVNKTLKHLEKNKIPYMISTNECRYSENDLRDNLNEIGIDISQQCEIYTSGMATRDYLKKKLEKNPNIVFYWNNRRDWSFETFELSEYKNSDL